MNIIKTDRLVIRQFRHSDAAALNRVFGDAAVMRFGDGVQSAAWVQRWLDRCFENYRQTAGIGPWAVVEKRRLETIWADFFEVTTDQLLRDELEID